MLVLKLFSFILFFLPLELMADIYFSGNYGLAGYTSNELEAYNVKPTGTTYGGLVGLRGTFLGVEGIYQKINTNALLDHNSTEHEYYSNNSIYGAAIKLFMPLLTIRAGYAYHEVEQYVTLDDVAIQNVALNRVYGITASVVEDSGLFYGAGLQLKLTKLIRLNLDYTHYNLDIMKSEFNTFTAGITFRIPLELKQLFSLEGSGP
jgi:opacity protein-like surface antigen